MNSIKKFCIAENSLLSKKMRIYTLVKVFGEPWWSQIVEEIFWHFWVRFGSKTSVIWSPRFGNKHVRKMVIKGFCIEKLHNYLFYFLLEKKWIYHLIFLFQNSWNQISFLLWKKSWNQSETFFCFFRLERKNVNLHII